VLGDGSNAVTLTSASLSEKGLTVVGGMNTDSVSLNNSAVGGALKVAFKDGSNAATLTESSVGKAFAFAGGVNTDSVTLDDSTLSGAAKFALQAGSNSVDVEAGSFVGKTLTVTGKEGNDFVRLEENSTFDADVKITLADGMNTVTLDTVTVNGDVKIKTGDGDDTITLAGEMVQGTTTIDSGGGMDNVTP